MRECGLQILRTDGNWYSAEYSTFAISDEVGRYRLTVGGYSGDAGDALASSPVSQFNANGMMFSTPDFDGDTCGCHCAADRSNGWWYQWCSTSVINYTEFDGIWVAYGRSIIGDVTHTHMMVKFM